MEILNLFFEGLKIVIIPIGSMFAAFLVLVLIFNLFRSYIYKKTEYYEQTHIKFGKMYNDTGLYGEYLVYENLKDLVEPRKFLFNVYIPKEDGKTTEIDVILITTSGIYVFESKNYSGYILGSEQNQVWTQSLNNSVCKTFYNPIKQNLNHIKHLRAYLGENNYPFYSIIAFGDRCKLFKIELDTKFHCVINIKDAYKYVNAISKKRPQAINAGEIDHIYSKLYPQTQFTDKQKQEHIDNIKKR